MHQSMAIPSAGIVEIERAELVMMFVPFCCLAFKKEKAGVYHRKGSNGKIMLR